jgi:hypothetical protein
LKLLKMQPEITQKDLSDLLDMRPQSLGTLLKKLAGVLYGSVRQNGTFFDLETKK